MKSIFLLAVFWGYFLSTEACARLRVDNLNPTEEMGFVELCVEFTATPLQTGGSITLQTSTSGANAPQDFIPLPITPIPVPAGQVSDICRNVTINTDNIIETTELFIATVSSNDITLCLEMTTVTVQITDSTVLPMRFTSRMFRSSNEAGVVDVCVELLSGTVETPTTYGISIVQGGTATSLVDFILQAPTITVTQSNSGAIPCSRFTVIPDTIIEEDESVVVTLSSNHFKLMEGDATVVITDDDGATLSLVSSSAQISEGNSGTTNVSLCVRLGSNLALTREIVVILNTIGVTADSRDYLELVNVSLTFPSDSVQNSQQCTVVQVVGDLIREGDELFRVDLRPQNTNDIITMQSFRVTIENDGDTIEDCGELPDPLNGTVTETPNTLENSTARYSCDPGFTLQGTETRTCLMTGMWSNLASTCQLRDCGNLPNPEGGRVDSNPSTFQSVAVYTCNMSFVLSSGGTTFNRTCQADGMWGGSAPTCIADCGSLSNPSNGNVSFPSTTFQSVASYMCDPGHSLVGESSRTCDGNGMWSGTAPTCEVRDCGTLPDPVGGRVDSNPSTFQSVAVYTCNMSFILSSGGTTFNRTCQADGMWGGSAPTCIADCGSLSNPSNGNVSFPSTTFQSVASYMCDPGHSLVGESSRTCDGNGMWSGTAPTCEVDCGALPPLMNGNIMTSGSGATVVGTQATYSCMENFTLLGDNMRVCMASGEWSPSAPTCENLNPVIQSSAENMPVPIDQRATANCTVLDISDTLLSSVTITWFDPRNVRVTTMNGVRFLEVDLGVSGTYTCNIVINSTLLAEAMVINSTFPFSRDALTAELPATSPDNSNLIIGLVLGVGGALVLIIVCVGTLVVCALCVRKKKNYKKYVLPYRSYMEANKNSLREHSNEVGDGNEIRLWENGRREHVLEAVDNLDKRSSRVSTT